VGKRKPSTLSCYREAHHTGHLIRKEAHTYIHTCDRREGVGDGAPVGGDHGLGHPGRGPGLAGVFVGSGHLGTPWRVGEEASISGVVVAWLIGRSGPLLHRAGKGVGDDNVVDLHVKRIGDLELDEPVAGGVDGRKKECNPFSRKEGEGALCLHSIHAFLSSP
jgi:hypothetical protein